MTWQSVIGLGSQQFYFPNLEVLINSTIWTLMEIVQWREIQTSLWNSNFKTQKSLTRLVLLLKTWTLVLWKVVEMWLTSWWVMVSLSRLTKFSHFFLHLFGSNFHFILTRYEGLEEHQEHFNNHQENQQQSSKNINKVN